MAVFSAKILYSRFFEFPESVTIPFFTSTLVPLRLCVIDILLSISSLIAESFGFQKIIAIDIIKAKIAKYV